METDISFYVVGANFFIASLAIGHYRPMNYKLPLYKIIIACLLIMLGALNLFQFYEFFMNYTQYVDQPKISDAASVSRVGIPVMLIGWGIYMLLSGPLHSQTWKRVVKVFLYVFVCFAWLSFCQRDFDVQINSLLALVVLTITIAIVNYLTRPLNGWI